MRLVLLLLALVVGSATAGLIDSLYWSDAHCDAEECGTIPDCQCAEFVARSFAAGGFIPGLTAGSSKRAFAQFMPNGGTWVNYYTRGAYDLCWTGSGNRKAHFPGLYDYLVSIGWSSRNPVAEAVDLGCVIFGQSGAAKSAPWGHSCFGIAPGMVNCHNVHHCNISASAVMYKGVQAVLCHPSVTPAPPSTAPPTTPPVTSQGSSGTPPPSTSSTPPPSTSSTPKPSTPPPSSITASSSYYSTWYQSWSSGYSSGSSMSFNVGDLTAATTTLARAVTTTRADTVTTGTKPPPAAATTGTPPPSSGATTPPPNTVSATVTASVSVITTTLQASTIGVDATTTQDAAVASTTAAATTGAVSSNARSTALDASTTIASEVATTALISGSVTQSTSITRAVTTTIASTTTNEASITALSTTAATTDVTFANTNEAATASTTSNVVSSTSAASARVTAITTASASVTADTAATATAAVSQAVAEITASVMGTTTDTPRPTFIKHTVRPSLPPPPSFTQPPTAPPVTMPPVPTRPQRPPLPPSAPPVTQAPPPTAANTTVSFLSTTGEPNQNNNKKAVIATVVGVGCLSTCFLVAAVLAWYISRKAQQPEELAISEDAIAGAAGDNPLFKPLMSSSNPLYE